MLKKKDKNSSGVIFLTSAVVLAIFVLAASILVLRSEKVKEADGKKEYNDLMREIEDFGDG